MRGIAQLMSFLLLLQVRGQESEDEIRIREEQMARDKEEMELNTRREEEERERQEQEERLREQEEEQRRLEEEERLRKEDPKHWPAIMFVFLFHADF